jgi:hypothetical protein
LLLVAGSASVHAQAPAAAAGAFPIEPSVDTPEQRQTLSKFSACLAQSRPRWARQTLAHAYLSEEQASIATQALKGNDSCVVGRDGAEVTFRTSALVGSLAEYFLRSELAKADMDRLGRALNTAAPLNASEDFGLCVASRNPAAARDLALSVPGSDAEAAAARSLANEVSPCIRRGERLTVDLQSLRALMSTALYRVVTAVGTSRS